MCKATWWHEPSSFSSCCFSAQGALYFPLRFQTPLYVLYSADFCSIDTFKDLNKTNQVVVSSNGCKWCHLCPEEPASLCWKPSVGTWCALVMSWHVAVGAEAANTATPPFICFWLNKNKFLLKTSEKLQINSLRLQWSHPVQVRGARAFQRGTSFRPGYRAYETVLSFSC